MHVTVPVHEATLTVSSFFFQRMNVKVNQRAVLSTLKDVGVFLCQHYLNKKKKKKKQARVLVVGGPSASISVTQRTVKLLNRTETRPEEIRS